jgi:hypothetical protein
MQRASPQLRSLIELRQAHVRKIWQRTLLLAAVAIALAHVQQREAKLGHSMGLIVALVAFVVPHASIWLGLNRGRLARLQREPVDPARFPSDEEKDVSVMTWPVQFGLRFRRRMTRSLVESLPDHERPTVRAIQTVERWNVGRLWALLIFGLCSTLFLNGAGVGSAALIVQISWLITLAASYPTIESWLTPDVPA